MEDEVVSIGAVKAAHPEAAARLAGRHGTDAPAIAALGQELDLLRPLVPGRPFLEVEVAWAVRHELALSVDDVLSRRLRLSPELGGRRRAVASRVAEIMSRELAWDQVECERQRDAYLESSMREYGVPGPP
jgi:glycerol-3-phosphate dehydrogenase